MGMLESLKFTFYIYSHPFDGFFVMKREKRVTYKTGLVLLLLFLVTTCMRLVNTGFLFSNSSTSNFSVFVIFAVALVTIATYVIANWSISTLTNGMGTLEEIFVSLMYSLTPIIIANIPLTVLSNFFVIKEQAYYSFINFIVILWAVFLLAASNMTIHEFTMKKSILIIIASILAMLAIAVLVFLACNLIQQVFLWFYSLFKELILRI